MSVPDPISNHTEIALGRLIEQFKQDKPVLHGLIRAHVDRLQDLEDNIWAVIWGRLLDYSPANPYWRAEGNQLDILGKIVGCARLGVTDAQYRDAIRLQIRINRSHGRTVDLLEIVRLAIPLPGTFTYKELFYNAWYFFAGGITTSLAIVIVNALSQARAAGYRAIFEYHTDAISSGSLFKFANNGTGGYGGAGHEGSSAYGGKLLSRQG